MASWNGGDVVYADEESLALDLDASLFGCDAHRCHSAEIPTSRRTPPLRSVKQRLRRQFLQDNFELLARRVQHQGQRLK